VSPTEANAIVERLWPGRRAAFRALPGDVQAQVNEALTAIEEHRHAEAAAAKAAREAKRIADADAAAEKAAKEAALATGGRLPRRVHPPKNRASKPKKPKTANAKKAG